MNVLRGRSMGVVGLPKGVNGIVQQFVHDAAGEVLQMLTLGIADVWQFGQSAAQLTLGQFVISLVELVDRGAQFPNAVRADVLVDGGGDDLSGGVDLADSAIERLRDGLLKIVDVVEIDVFQHPHGGVDVARQGDVDQENRPETAAAMNGGKCGGRDDGFGRAGGGDDDVHLRKNLIQLIHRRWDAVEFFRQSGGLGGIAVGNQQLAGRQGGETAQHQVGHFSGADAQHRFVVKVIENSAGEINGNAGDAQAPL